MNLFIIRINLRKLIGKYAIGYTLNQILGYIYEFLIKIIFPFKSKPVLKIRKSKINPFISFLSI